MRQSEIETHPHNMVKPHSTKSTSTKLLGIEQVRVFVTSKHHCVEEGFLSRESLEPGGVELW